MQDVSTKLLGQFAECLESKIGEPEVIEGIAAASAEAAGGTATDAAADSSSGHAPAHAASKPGKDDDDEVLDLLDVAGAAVFKRFIPVAVAIVALIIILVMVF
jgi:hypothetical protein